MNYDPLSNPPNHGEVPHYPAGDSEPDGLESLINSPMAAFSVGYYGSGGFSAVDFDGTRFHKPPSETYPEGALDLLNGMSQTHTHYLSSSARVPAVIKEQYGHVWREKNGSIFLATERDGVAVASLLMNSPKGSSSRNSVNFTIAVPLDEVTTPQISELKSNPSAMLDLFRKAASGQKAYNKSFDWFDMAEFATDVNEPSVMPQADVDLIFPQRSPEPPTPSPARISTQEPTKQRRGFFRRG